MFRSCRALAARRGFFGGATPALLAASLHHSEMSTPDRATVNRANRKELMTPLCQDVLSKITAQQFYPISQYIRDCLTHPLYGYYTTKQGVITGANSGSAATAAAAGAATTGASVVTDNQRKISPGLPNTATLASPSMASAPSASPSEGDFITAAEIPFFGMVLAGWVIDCWQKMGSPRAIHLVELGPGRGTLMRSILGHIKLTVPQLFHFTTVHLVEVGSARTAEQKKALTEFQTSSGKIKWWLDIESLPATHGEPMIIFSNEYFDALPIAQFYYGERGWAEVCLEQCVDPTRESHFKLVSAPGGSFTGFLIPPSLRRGRRNSGTDRSHIMTGPTSSMAIKGGLAAGPAAAASAASTLSSYEGIGSAPSVTDDYAPKVGDLLEVCSTGMQHMEILSRKIIDAGKGAILTIDYGEDEHIMKNTLRGIRKHKFVDPLLSPGDVDLSAWVSFKQLRWALERLEQTRNELKWYPVMTQADFLTMNGIDIVLARAIKEEDSKSALRMLQAFRRLIDTDEMGKTYKVFCVQSRNFPACAPFFKEMPLPPLESHITNLDVLNNNNSGGN